MQGSRPSAKHVATPRDAPHVGAIWREAAIGDSGSAVR
jgi:hypothetical protein